MAASSSESPLSRQELEFLYHHVFLPPEVPQSDDYRPELDLLLMQVARDGLAALNERAASAQRGSIAAAARMLRGMQSIHKSGDIEAAQVLKTFDLIMDDGKSRTRSLRYQ